MKILLFAAVIGLTLSSPVNAKAESTPFPFLIELPTQMTCEATYLKAFSANLSAVSGGVVISIEAKDSETPEIEVFAPGIEVEEHQHFKIGNGYHGDLVQIAGKYEYLSLPSSRSFAYLRAPVPARPLTMQDYMRQRTQGGLVAFSGKRIVLGYNAIILGKCVPDGQ
ncbi:MAG: hypothetical protein EOP06_03465 [Proteobacteria bacterium]|nr:MAG: hypothetical protein EOP06_03465 [Pseudomonadota bacterium]